MKYLAFFNLIHPFEDFCLAELKSLATLCGVPLPELFQHELPVAEFPAEQAFRVQRGSFRNFPFAWLQIESAVALEEISLRAVLINCFVEVLAQGGSYEELLVELQQPATRADILASQESYCV